MKPFASRSCRKCAAYKSIVTRASGPRNSSDEMMSSSAYCRVWDDGGGARLEDARSGATLAAAGDSTLECRCDGRASDRAPEGYALAGT